PYSVAVRDVRGAVPGPSIPLADELQLVSQISFSPNPDRFFFMTTDLHRGSLYIADLTGTPSAVKVVDGELRGDRINPVHWSPDGTRFAYAKEVVTGSFQFESFIAPADNPTQASPSLTSLPPGGLGQLSSSAGLWAPDSSRYVTISADGSNLFVSDRDGVSTRIVLLDDNLAFASLIGWSPDSSLLIISAFDLTARGDRLYALNPDDDGPATLALTPAELPVNPGEVSISPDGAGVAVGDVSGSWVFVADLRSAQLAAPLQRIAGVAAFPGWSPDSRRLAVFTSNDGSQLDVYERDQPGTKVSVAVPLQGDFDFAHVQWSADSQTLLASTNEGVFSLPASGGAAALLLNEAPRDYDLVPGASPAFFYSDATGVFALDATGAPLSLDAHPEPWSLSVAHQRGAAFYFHFGDGTATGKLWMIDLAGAAPGPPVELLDFGQGSVTYDVSDATDVGPQ
ncbi:MAG TPA: WD40 repeat domain-containing protein, partial [Myxococcales bacterium]|nr:WD40 repeat domain-containing protein [Myxococcales bacterium]